MVNLAFKTNLVTSVSSRSIIFTFFHDLSACFGPIVLDLFQTDSKSFLLTGVYLNAISLVIHFL